MLTFEKQEENNGNFFICCCKSIFSDVIHSSAHRGRHNNGGCIIKGRLNCPVDHCAPTVCRNLYRSFIQPASTLTIIRNHTSRCVTCEQSQSIFHVPWRIETIGLVFVWVEGARVCKPVSVCIVGPYRPIKQFSFVFVCTLWQLAISGIYSHRNRQATIKHSLHRQ